MEQDTYYIFSSVMSICALIISVFSLLLHLVNQHKTKFNLKIFFDKKDCFYFDGIDTRLGNRESLVLSTRIVNDSNQPINISDIQIILGKCVYTSATKISKILYPEYLSNETFATLKGDDGLLYIKSVDVDGYHILDLENKLLKSPIYLKPYESVDGYLLFLTAGVSMNKMQKTKIKIITSRKTKIVCGYFPSKKYHESWFK